MDGEGKWVFWRTPTARFLDYGGSDSDDDGDNETDDDQEPEPPTEGREAVKQLAPQELKQQTAKQIEEALLARSGRWAAKRGSLLCAAGTAVSARSRPGGVPGTPWERERDARPSATLASGGTQAPKHS